MANPRDWFRRRRPSLAAAPRQDPFADEDILDLGRSAIMLRESAPISVPPPERTAEGGRRIRANAFAVRPELAWREPGEPPRMAAPPALAAPVAERGDLPRQRLAGSVRRADRVAPELAPLPRAVKPEPSAPPGPSAAVENPAFALAAPGPTWLRGRAEADQPVNALLRDAFTPTRPKQDATLFFGRFREMQRIIAAIEEERAHVVVYGERGSGKTSLCNMLAGKATEAGYFVQHFACSSGVGFEDICRHILRRIPASYLAEGLGGQARVENFEELLPERALAVGDLVEIFARIHERHVIVIIDEYDRVVSEDVKGKLAELIKIMSDQAVPVTLLLIGVADDVRDLFGKHPSLQRTLVTVPMPLMSRRDLEGLLAAAEARARLVFAPAVRDAIIDFAQGLPYHAQLLGLFAARSAVRRQSRIVEPQDFRFAVERAAEEAESRIKDAYARAVGTPAQAAFEDVLYRAARARSDEFGAFTAADVGVPELQAPLQHLTEPARGAILRRIDGVAGVRYQFSTQMLRHYVLVRQAVQRGLV
jgi:Cdc6-like AAA superfamily ATPase